MLIPVLALALSTLTAPALGPWRMRRVCAVERARDRVRGRRMRAPYTAGLDVQSAARADRAADRRRHRHLGDQVGRRPAGVSAVEWRSDARVVAEAFGGLGVSALRRGD